MVKPSGLKSGAVYHHTSPKNLYIHNEWRFDTKIQPLTLGQIEIYEPFVLIDYRRNLRKVKPMIDLKILSGQGVIGWVWVDRSYIVMGQTIIT